MAIKGKGEGGGGGDGGSQQMLKEKEIGEDNRFGPWLLLLKASES